MRCHDCALLETRVSELELPQAAAWRLELANALRSLETRLAALEEKPAAAPTPKVAICGRCQYADPVLRRCQHCEVLLCLFCLRTETCAHDRAGKHEGP